MSRLANIDVGGAEALPLSVLLSAIPSLPRAVLSRLTERMIDRLDAMDGDPDLEPNGDDERTGDEGEPDFRRTRCNKGPGCPIADPDCCLASDDRGGGGPNATFPGFVAHKQYDDDNERWHQPTHLAGGGAAS